MRIVAISAAGTVELNPQAGADYAFDSDMPNALNDLAEGHGMERSKRLYSPEQRRVMDDHRPRPRRGAARSP